MKPISFFPNCTLPFFIPCLELFESYGLLKFKIWLNIKWRMQSKTNVACCSVNHHVILLCKLKNIFSIAISCLIMYHVIWLYNSIVFFRGHHDNDVDLIISDSRLATSQAPELTCATWATTLWPLVTIIGLRTHRGQMIEQEGSLDKLKMSNFIHFI